jgi:2-polyprenyl-3-methyl-5-hydroxy-6-metoxy-1,4-benzoquinol methylase
MAAAVLFPRYDHPAVEESYASWQSEMLLRRGVAEFYHYDQDETAKHAVRELEAKHVLVITDPLLLPAPQLGERLAALIAGDVFAAIPSSSQSANETQRMTLPPYLTLRELEIETTNLQKGTTPPERLTWDGSDPGVFLCRVADLESIEAPLRSVLTGKPVILSRTDFVHRWPPLRGDSRLDLLDRIDPGAKSILEFGCGEGSLGEALKKRQKCRVVGIEIDRDAAARAKKRMDDVYCGDAREIVELIHEEFEWIVGGDIVEHLNEPWSFLSDLRRISKPDGHLLLSIPNVANASIVADLLRGRFDYVYMGLACVGHLRFFTRRSIEDMIAIAGWDIEKIEPHELTVTSGRDTLIAQLEAARVPFSKDDLLPTGYYVTARNRK